MGHGGIRRRNYCLFGRTQHAHDGGFDACGFHGSSPNGETHQVRSSRNQRTESGTGVRRAERSKTPALNKGARRKSAIAACEPQRSRRRSCSGRGHKHGKRKEKGGGGGKKAKEGGG